MPIGFSTGSIALGNFNLALQILRNQDVHAVELSALREEELHPLFLAINDLDVKKYEYISVHAPSKRVKIGEPEFVEILKAFAEKTWPIVIHPDVIVDHNLWRALGKKFVSRIWTSASLAGERHQT